MDKLSGKKTALDGSGDCQGCLKPWRRGHDMYAITSDNHQFLGWFCEVCLDGWTTPIIGCQPADPKGQPRWTGRRLRRHPRTHER